MHDSDVRAIERLRAAGVVVTIATGRTPAATLHVAADLELSGPGVCTDGAMIVELTDGDVLRHRTVGSVATVALAEAIGAFPHVAATVLLGSTVVLDERGGILERVAASWSPLVDRTTRLLDHPCWEHPEGITAAAVIGLSAQIARIVEILTEQPLALTHFEVTRFEGLSSLIIHGDGVSKGDGLRWLAAHHGKSVDETVTVGDWLNDVPMLELAPRSFAMAHAPARVKRAAKHVLDATREGGAIAEIARRVWDL